MSAQASEPSGGTPTVSVILPTYNRVQLVGRAIRSVLDQTYRDFELIIVDDGSTDGTEQVVERFNDERIQYVRHSENRGLQTARNTGIEISRGRYIAFQDSDDEWLAEKLERQVETFARSSSEVGVIYSSFWQIKPNTMSRFPHRITRLARLLPFRVTRLEGDIRFALLRGNFVTSQAVLVRKECFDKVGLFDERLPLFGDWDLWIRLSRHYQFRYINEPLVLVYFTPDSMSTDQAALKEGFRLILEKHGEEHPRNNDLLAHCSYAMGDLAYRNGDLNRGQSRLLKAVKLRPFSVIHWIATLTSLFGQDVYAKVTESLGISYAR